VGAQLGARIVAHEIARQSPDLFDLNWGRVTEDAAYALHEILRRIGAVAFFSQRIDVGTVLDMFLFTAVAAVITKEKAVFAALGDGVVIVNGERQTLGPFPNNMPPYLAYRLVPSQMPSDLLQFKVLKEISTKELDNFLIGSDGVDDLIAAEEKHLPGITMGVVGDLDTLWSDDRYFKNSDALRRRLTLVNGGIDRKHQGYLKDDTTIVVGRRIRHG
jgi:hypothetical protein